VQKAAAQLAIEMPYEEAQTLFSDLTGVPLGSERLGSLVFPGVQNCDNINKLYLHVHVLKC